MEASQDCNPGGIRRGGPVGNGMQQFIDAPGDILHFTRISRSAQRILLIEDSNANGLFARFAHAPSWSMWPSNFSILARTCLRSARRASSSSLRPAISAFNSADSF